jgi:hypothetical protein
LTTLQPEAGTPDLTARLDDELRDLD